MAVRVAVGAGVPVVVEVAAGVPVAVPVGVAPPGVAVGVPQMPPVSVWLPSKSWFSARAILLAPVPSKKMTRLPGALGSLSSRSIVMGPVLHSLPTTWRLSWLRTPPLGAL